MKPYEEYRKTDVPWIADIPNNWQVKPLYTVASESKISNAGMKNDNLLSLSFGRIIRKSIDTATGLLPESFETYQVIKKQSLIFRLTDLQNDKRSLRSAIATEDGIITSAYVATVPTKIRPKYFHYLMRSYDTTKVFYNLGSGMRQSLKYSELKHLPVVLPPESTQASIERFLDRHLEQIDNLISEKQNFIKLLEEKRQALISHVVTKGLDDSVEMKDSGIEWIGNIPSTWTISKLGFNLEAIGDVDHYMPDSIESGVPYIMTGDLMESASDIKFDSCKQVSQKDYVKLSKKIRTSKGDVIMARYATIGTVAYVDIDKEFLVSYSCVTIKPKKSKLTGRYLYYYLKSNALLQGIQSHVNTNTQGNVGIGDLRKVKVTVPDLECQNNIVKFLDKSLSKIDFLIKETSTSVELLKERRTALIGAAVTGKIDVREEV